MTSSADNFGQGAFRAISYLRSGKPPNCVFVYHANGDKNRALPGRACAASGLFLTILGLAWVESWLPVVIRELHASVQKMCSQQSIRHTLSSSQLHQVFLFTLLSYLIKPWLVLYRQRRWGNDSSIQPDHVSSVWYNLTFSLDVNMLFDTDHVIFDISWHLECR